MAKTSNLAAALKRTKQQSPAEEAAPPVQPVEDPKPKAPAKSKRAPVRAGQSNISAWFDMPVRHTLDELCLKRKRELGRRVTTQELMGEALNDLFKKYGLPEVAPTDKRGR